jgi:anti-sigma B factor antagonist
MLKQLQYCQDNHQWRGSLAGGLDAVQAPKLLSVMKDALEQNPGDVVLDCKQLDFVDSMGLGALVKLRKMAEEKNGTIKLERMKPRIYKLFVITGLEGTMGIEVEQ